MGPRTTSELWADCVATSAGSSHAGDRSFGQTRVLLMDTHDSRISLSDGTPIRFRRIRPGDTARLSQALQAVAEVPIPTLSCASRVAFGPAVCARSWTSTSSTTSQLWPSSVTNAGGHLSALAAGSAVRMIPMWRSSR